MGIRERILARPDLDAMRAARDITGLANALNSEGFTASAPRFITSRAVLTSCGVHGPAIMAALKAASDHPAVGVALDFLRQEAGLDIGDPYTQGMLDLLVPSVLTAPQAAAVKALAVQPVVVTQTQVADAMYNPDGTEK